MLFNLFPKLKFPNNPSTFKFSIRAKVTTLWLIAAIAVIFIFYFARILPVFIYAAITAYLFGPLITFLAGKTKLAKPFWIIVLYLLLGSLLYWVIKTVAPILATEVSDLVSGSLNDPTTFLGRIAALGSFSVLGITFNLKELVLIFSGWLQEQFPTHALPIFFQALHQLVLLVIYFVVTFYLILESGSYIEWFKQIIPHPYRQEIADLLERINLTLGAYIRAQVILIIVMTLVSFICLFLLRLKYALILSIMTGVLEIIPVVGPIFATAVAALVALFQAGTPFGFSNLTYTVLIIAVYFALRQLEDYFVVPSVVSRFVRVQPVVAIFALMIGGTVAGVLGLFLAIPVAAIVIVLLVYLHQKLVEE